MVASLLASACLWSSVCAIGQDAKPAIDPKADVILRKMAEYYRDAKSGTAAIKINMKVQMQGMNTEIASDYDLAFKRPNRFALRGKPAAFNPLAGMAVVSDGTKLFSHFPMLKKYTSEDAPKSLDGILGGQMNPAMGMMGGMHVFIDALFRDDPYRTMMEGVTAGSYVASETLDGIECHRLKFVQEAMDWEIWIAAGNDSYVVKLVPDMSKSLIKARDLKQLPGELREMKMQHDIRLTDWKKNPDLPDNRFQFDPPGDAKLVESFFDGLASREKHRLLSQAAPDVKVALLGGGKLDLAAHKGRDIVILDFWATWCGPCVQALPILTEVAAAYRERGVVFYAVNQEEDAKTIEAFLQKKNLSMTVALDADGAIGARYGVEGIPQTVIIGKDGIVEAVHVGLLPGLKQKLQKELDTLLAGKKLAGDKSPAAK
ncbi:MAG: DUF2092 domain-containing protein [Verrucomicrobiota bacterium]